MANFFSLIDITEDPLYIKGFAEGIRLAKLKGGVDYQNVKSLIINTDFDDAKIAFLLAVTEEYVAKIREEIAAFTEKK